MPSGLNVDGFVTRRPGVYANVDVSALDSATLETNNLAIVGSFPFVQGPGSTALGNATQLPVPKVLNNASALKKLHSKSTELQTLIPLIYSPANDPAVAGMPQTVSLVNVTPNTQASNTFTNAGGQDVLTLKSSLWGTVGNKTFVSVVANAGDASLRDWTISRDGATEDFSEVGSPDLIGLTYTGTEFSAVTAAMDNGVLSLSSTAASKFTAGAVSTVECKIDEGQFAALGATFNFTITVDGTAIAAIEVTKAGDVPLTYDAIVAALTGAALPVSAARVDNITANPAVTIQPVRITSKFAGTGTISVTVDDNNVWFTPTANEGVETYTQTLALAGGADFSDGSYISATAAQSGTVNVQIVSATHLNATAITGLSAKNSFVVTIAGTVGGVATTETAGYNDATHGTDFTLDGTTLTYTTTASFDGQVTVTVGQGTTNLYVVDAVPTVYFSWTHPAVGYISETVELVEALTDEGDGKGYHSTALDPQSGGVYAKYIDDFTATTLSAVATGVTAHTWFTYTVLSDSALVVASFAEEPLDADWKGGQIASFVGKTLFTGGNEGTAVDADWTTAFNVMRDPANAVEIFAALTTTLSQQKIVRDHCKYMAGLGRHECLAWCGAPSKTAIGSATTGLKYTANQINSRFVGLAFQDIYVANSIGETQWLTPEYTAVMFAAMQASTPVSTPLTRKVPNVLSIRQSVNITLTDDIETLLKNGLVTIMPTAKGWWIERSVTTYLTDDNMVLSEMSANESVNTSIRDLRSHLTKLIGTGNVASTKSNIENITRLRLKNQVDTDIIKAFSAGSIVVTDLGDTYSVAYTAAPVFPVNFIKLEASFVATL